jgi:hypothetical protein
MECPFCGYCSASFSRHPCYCPVSSWPHWPWWQGWRSHMDAATWSFTHQDQLGYQHCLSMPASEINRVLDMTTQCDQLASWKQINYIRLFLLWKGQCVRCRLPCPVHLQKPWVSRIRHALSWSFTQCCLWSSSPLHRKEVRYNPGCVEFTAVTHSPLPGAAGLPEWLLKSQLWHHQGGNT